MLGLYTPVFLLQAFCVYHAYRNNSEQRWYWLILFFPLVGSIIYIVHHFNNVSSLNKLKENVREAVINNYKIEQLEKALRFTDTIKNKLLLADEYVKVGRYKDAITLYSSCQEGFMSDDAGVKMKLLYAYFMDEDYNNAAELGRKLSSEKLFKNAEERVLYAWSLFYLQKPALAEAVFTELDKSFTNYYHRKEYCKFLMMTEKKDLAKDKLSELIQEFDHINGQERRLSKAVFREIKDLYSTLAQA
jgi:hypothetical protein